jgi:hypothetical protein
MAKSAARTFEFRARLERDKGYYSISIPASVSRAIGKRGPVPVVATVNRSIEVRASIVPCGGGRHRLQLNARARGDADAAPGDTLAVALRVDENPVADPTPPDLERALRDQDVLGAFERLPVGKRNHILHWIEEAVADRTREKRIDKTVEVATRAREKEHDRAVAGERVANTKHAKHR